LITAYQQIEKRIGNPLDPATLVGPLIDKFAVDGYKNALSAVEAQVERHRRRP
jgi:aldehyde dehydrogenase (NAD+)